MVRSVEWGADLMWWLSLKVDFSQAPPRGVTMRINWSWFQLHVLGNRVPTPTLYLAELITTSVLLKMIPMCQNHLLILTILGTLSPKVPYGKIIRQTINHHHYTDVYN